jgi:hypothetical protein
MMYGQCPAREFGALPLRVHALLADVPLHDAWAIDLPWPRAGITLDEFRRAAGGQLYTPSPVVRALLDTRLLVGRFFGWDRPSSEGASPTFADRLTPEDRARSLAPAGQREGPFRIVYRFENEQLDEVINRTAHAAALSALVETAGRYRFYLAVYVRNVGRLTPLYMTLIDPFRKLIVYPSLLRGVRAKWNRAVATSSA